MINLNGNDSEIKHFLGVHQLTVPLCIFAMQALYVCLIEPILICDTGANLTYTY